MNAPATALVIAGSGAADAAPSPSASSVPDIRLFGKVDDAMLRDFLVQLDAARQRPGALLVEITTIGGDADVGRRMALEIRLLRESRGELVRFFGKTVVYSAGVTLMSAFAPEDRWLSADAVLLIHERKMEKTVQLAGALRACIAVARDLVAEIENGQMLEREGFEELIRGSRLTIDEVMQRVRTANWYIPAAEAERLGLIAGVI